MNPPPIHQGQQTLRAVHHFACTGGTLFARCIAAMPEVNVLSEVDPLSTLMYKPEQPRFSPSDLPTLLRQSSRGASEELILEVFMKQLRYVYRMYRREGIRLVLRDHAHGHYCIGPGVPQRPNLREILLGSFAQVLSVVTVRDPIDSYISIVKLGWNHFEPKFFSEYCKRYHVFLDAYQGHPVLRYEDLIAQPDATMRQLCQALKLQFNPGFQSEIAHIRLSGNSGRKGDVIAPRERAPVPPALPKAARANADYLRLIERLGYPCIEA